MSVGLHLQIVNILEMDAQCKNCNQSFKIVSFSQNLNHKITTALYTALSPLEINWPLAIMGDSTLAFLAIC
jgi:hypothetical protein